MSDTVVCLLRGGVWIVSNTGTIVKDVFNFNFNLVMATGRLACDFVSVIYALLATVGFALREIICFILTGTMFILSLIQEFLYWFLGSFALLWRVVLYVFSQLAVGVNSVLQGIFYVVQSLLQWIVSAFSMERLVRSLQQTNQQLKTVFDNSISAATCRTSCVLTFLRQCYTTTASSFAHWIHSGISIISSAFHCSWTMVRNDAVSTTGLPKIDISDAYSNTPDSVTVPVEVQDWQYFGVKFTKLIALGFLVTLVLLALYLLTILKRRRTEIVRLRQNRVVINDYSDNEDNDTVPVTLQNRRRGRLVITNYSYIDRRRIAQRNHTRQNHTVDNYSDNEDDTLDMDDTDSSALNSDDDSVNGENVSVVSVTDDDDDYGNETETITDDSDTISDTDTNADGIDVQLPDQNDQQDASRASLPGHSADLDRALCVVCQDQVKSVLLLPCRHLCMCVGCARTIANGNHGQGRTCPLCRSSFYTVMNVYT